MAQMCWYQYILSIMQPIGLSTCYKLLILLNKHPLASRARTHIRLQVDLGHIGILEMMKAP